MARTLTVENCGKCGNPAADFVELDARVGAILKDHVNLANLPKKVCNSCFALLTKDISQGVKLRLEQSSREKNRHLVWKSRVHLIRHARQLMAQKAYSEAAVSYEKYIRVLEISYDLKPGALSPDVFGKSSRSKELTVITTTYWDLLRIYDTNSKHRPRMALAAKKLSQFIPYSPLNTGIIKNAQIFATNAKNPDIVKQFLKMCKAQNRRCFIATATFQDPYHPTVISLRLYRDAVLTQSLPGRGLMRVYYFISPTVAIAIERCPPLRSFFKPLLQRLTRLLDRSI